jgi:hypothetical protein
MRLSRLARTVGMGLLGAAIVVFAIPRPASAQVQTYYSWHTGNYSYWGGGGAPPGCYGVIGGAPAMGYPGAYYGYPSYYTSTRFLASPERPNYRPVYGEQALPPTPTSGPLFVPSSSGTTAVPTPPPSPSPVETPTAEPPIPMIPGTKPVPGPGSGPTPLPTVPKGPGQKPPGSAGHSP